MKFLFTRHFDKNTGDQGGAVADDLDQSELEALGDKINFNTASGKYGADGNPITEDGDPPINNEVVEEDGDSESEEANGDGSEESGDGDQELDFSLDEGDGDGSAEDGGDSAQEGGDASDEEVFDLAEIDPALESPDDVRNLIAERDSYRAQLEEANEKLKNPQFDNEAQKKLFEFAKKFQGAEMQAARSYLRIQGLDLDQLSEKDLIIEGWNLDEKYQNIPAKDKSAYFEAKFEQEFGEIDEENVLQKTEFSLQAQQARKKISAAQEEFANAHSEEQGGDQFSEEQAAELRNGITQAVQNYDGNLEISIGEDISVNVEVGNDSESLINSSMDVPEMWNKLLKDAGAINDDGTYDLQNYTKMINEIQNRDKIYQSMYNQGAEDREVFLRKKYGKPTQKPGSEGAAKPNKPKSTEGSSAFNEQKDLAEAIESQLPG